MGSNLSDNWQKDEERKWTAYNTPLDGFWKKKREEFLHGKNDFRTPDG